MMYDINTEKAKANSICRLCKKNVNVGDIRVKVGVSDGYSQRTQCFHTDCFLRYIIREIKKIRVQDLEKELASFKKIEKLLGEK